MSYMWWRNGSGTVFTKWRQNFIAKNLNCEMRIRRMRTKWNEHSRDATKLPIAVVGGGPVGLLMCIFLRRMNVPTILVEKRPLQNQFQCKDVEHPKAHVLHARSMEIFRQLGLEQKILQLVKPNAYWRNFRYCESLLGETFISKDHLATNSYKMLLQKSPSKIVQLSQPSLEKLLRDELLIAHPSSETQKANCEVLDEHECVDIDISSPEKIVLQLEDKSTSSVKSVACRYLVAADGAHSVVRRNLSVSSSRASSFCCPGGC